jgi:hypothetical protein
MKKKSINVLVLAFLFACNVVYGNAEIQQIFTSTGMTGIDFGDYIPNTYHMGPKPETSMIPDHGLKIAGEYSDRRPQLMWKDNVKTDPTFNGPALTLVRILDPWEDPVPDPIEFSFWAKDGSGKKAAVSSVFFWFLASPDYNLEFYDVNGYKIGDTIRIDPAWEDGLGFKAVEDGQEVSLIHKVLIRYIPLQEINWACIYGGENSEYDIYYKNYAIGGPTTCTELQGSGRGLAGDVDGNCVVNMADFAVIAEDWLVCNDPILAANPSSGCAANW